MKFLNLVIYSDSEQYLQMYNVLNEIYSMYENNSIVQVKTIFVKHSDYDGLQNNILHIKGEECLIPGVLRKTLKAFEYFADDLWKYDYIVRSNISTIIDFIQLSIHLEEKPIIFYGGGEKVTLQWIHERDGITDTKWLGTNFIVGTCIILTPPAVKFILAHEEYIHFDIIDDVSIGILMMQHNTACQVQGMNDKYLYIQQNCNLFELQNIVSQGYCIFYRNKNINRDIDIIHMKIIKNTLLQQIDKLR